MDIGAYHPKTLIAPPTLLVCNAVEGMLPSLAVIFDVLDAHCRHIVDVNGLFWS